MKCSKLHTCPHSCDAKVPAQLSGWIELKITEALKATKVPAGLANKVASIIDSNIDSCYLCDLIHQEIKQVVESTEIKLAKGRILDRAIVHNFELLYASVIENSGNPRRIIRTAPTFFNIVPRGDCLDLFLEMIKSQCIGKEKVAVYTRKLELLLAGENENEDEVNWQHIYQSHKFLNYSYGLFTVIFNQMTKSEHPIPALNNGMNTKDNPERINRVLKVMLEIWQLKQAEDIQRLTS